MGGSAGPGIRERKTDVQRALTSRRSHLDRKVGPPVPAPHFCCRVAATKTSLSKLVDVPTPAGPTRRQIGAAFVQITSSRSIVPPTSRLTEDFGLDNRTREPQSIVHRQQGTDPQHDPHR